MRHLPRISREWILLRLPAPLLEWPFEVMMAFYALVAGSCLATGLLDSGSVAALFPEWGARALGGVFLVGGIDVAWGLRHRSYYTAVPRGLRLLAVGIGAYTVCILVAGGVSRSGAAALIVGGVAALCAIRSLYLRGKAEILGRVVAASKL